MSNQKISIVAKILAKEGKREFVKNELIKLSGLSKSDEGCINYDLHQDNENPKLFVVYENWENKDALQKHASSKHFVNYVELTKEAVEEFIVHEMTIIA